MICQENIKTAENIIINTFLTICSNLVKIKPSENPALKYKQSSEVFSPKSTMLKGKNQWVASERERSPVLGKELKCIKKNLRGLTRRKS